MGCQNCILRVQWHFLRIFFSKNHINWHCERKNSAGFVQTAFYFSGELLSKTILEVVPLDFFLVPVRFFMHGLPKLYSTCPEALFPEFFSQNLINWHCERKKNQLVLTDLLSFFPGNFWAKNSRFLVLARFFKHGLPKLYSTCPVALSAEFFFRRIILIGTVSEKVQLVLSKLHSTFPGNFWANNSRSCPFGFFPSPCQILQAWVAKIVFYVSRGTFCGIFFTESY